MDSNNTNNPIIPNENEGSSPVVSDAATNGSGRRIDFDNSNYGYINTNQNSIGNATPSDPEIVPEVQPEPSPNQ